MIELHNADCFNKLRELEDNSVDSVVTDPPYFLSFMGKDWDKLDGNIAANVEFWKEILRVLKPGGYLLAFGHSRTHHRLYIAIEDAGFEIRDTIMWLYGSGFPKSHNISKAIDKESGATRTKVRIDASSVRNPKSINSGHGVEGGDRPWMREAIANGFHEKDSDDPATEEAAKWKGWGTALKPAHEPICLARKPLEGTVATNVLKHGVGGLNIDESRVGTDDKLGRWPANVVLDEEAGEELDNQTGISKPKKERRGKKGGSLHFGRGGEAPGIWPADPGGGASRFFYCAKVSKKERNAGCDELEEKVSASTEFRPNHAEKAEEGEGGTPYGRWNKLKNNHPTVKPKALMTYLIKLITPAGGKVLDPFMGSGSTGVAAKEAGFSFIGIERETEYYEIAKARIGVE
jgi:site-specific DNA-methyltransferase (adenine-specific)